LPWACVSEHAREHFPNGSNAFGEVHLAMVAAASRDSAALSLCAQRLERLASEGYWGARAALKWVAALNALLIDRQGDADRFFEECEAEAVRLGGSHAQRSVISETRRVRRLPTV